MAAMGGAWGAAAMRLLSVVLLVLLVQDGADAFTSPPSALLVHGRVRASGLAAMDDRPRSLPGLLSLSASSPAESTGTTTAGRTPAEGDALKISRAEFLRGFIALPTLSAIGSTAAGASPPPLAGEEIRPLTKEDVPAFLSLTKAVDWADTKFDLELLTSSPDRYAVGAFVGGELLSTTVVVFMPESQVPEAGGKGLGWLSFVATRPDMRRKGLARRCCAAALAWLDDNHPKSPLGLYGEKVKAAPLYRDLGFMDVGKTFHWTTSVSPMSLLRSDMSIQKTADGMYEVPNKVDRISLGSTTAIRLKGKELMDSVLKADNEAFGADRSDAFKAWAKRYGDLCWVVREVDQKKVKFVFDKYATAQKGVGKLVQFEGFGQLQKDTGSAEPTRKLWDDFCVRSGADPSTGLPLEALQTLYSLPGNNVEVDYAKVTGGAVPTDTDQGIRGYILGRDQLGDKGYFLGPIFAKDQECATTLLLAAVRGGSARHLAANKPGLARFDLMVVEGGTGDGVKTAKPKSDVLEVLGFKQDYGSTFMVRNGDVKSFSRGDFSKTYGASSYEFA